MKKDVFLAALEATARVACCAALVGGVGCQPKKVQQINTPAVEEEKVEETREETPVEINKESDPLLNGMASAKKEASPTFIACQEKIDDFLKNTSQNDPNQEWPKDIVNCCAEQAKEVDASPDLEVLFHRPECCDVLNWRGSRACTPWGPPTPPKMV